MALATITLSEEFTRDGRPLYEIRCEPWGEAPFAGPADRNWDGFSATKDEASYDFRSGVDRLCAAAADFLARKRTARDIAADPAIGWWFDRKSEQWLHDSDTDKPPKHERVVARMLRAIADGTLDIDAYDGPYAYYYYEDDNYFADAARALDLPPWARITVAMGGGPGSGYVQPCLQLDEGKTLLDLQAWLEAILHPGK